MSINDSYMRYLPLVSDPCNFRRCNDPIGETAYPWFGFDRITPQYFCCSECRHAEAYLQFEELQNVSGTVH